MKADEYKYIRFNASQETRWATEDELRHSCAHINLTDDNYPVAGLPIMSDAKEAYVDDKDSHSLIFGSTGSKKTRLFVMPSINMMAKAGESFIVTDPKGELYAQTSGLVKEKGYKTVVLNFRDIGKGDMWNPLSIPYDIWQSGDHDEAGMLLSDIAAAIAAPFVRSAKDAFWPEAAQQLAIAALYILMESASPAEVNMKSFANICAYGNVDNLKELIGMMREDSIAHLNLSSTLTDAKVTVSGIVSTLGGMLRLFCVNEKLSKMLSDTTFDMRDIGREKTAVYLIVPDEKTTYHFLVTTFIKQVYEVLIIEAQKEKNRQLPIRVNFVLDEFCNIPMIPDMPSMISAARSRNIRYFLVVQSLHQLKDRYGDSADTIKGNCDNWVFLTSKELALLNEISKLCGEITTPTNQKRPLISTSELQRLSKERGEALIMHARQYPIITELPDISMYDMFGIYPEAPMMSQEEVQVKCFSVARLLEKIGNQRAIAPFASYKHMCEQAYSIFNSELSKEDAEDYLRPRFSSTRGDLERLFGKDASKTAAANDRKAKIDKAIAAAKKRIAALVNDEFAQKYFDEKLYEKKNDDDDDDDFGF